MKRPFLATLLLLLSLSFGLAQAEPSGNRDFDAFSARAKANQAYLLDRYRPIRGHDSQPVLFGQASVNSRFSRAGRFRGRDLYEVAAELAANPNFIRQFEIQFIWVNRTKIVVNNRSLTTVAMANRMRRAKNQPALFPTFIDMTNRLPDDGPDALVNVLARLDEIGGEGKRTQHIRMGEEWNAPLGEEVSIEEVFGRGLFGWVLPALLPAGLLRPAVCSLESRTLS